MNATCRRAPSFAPRREHGAPAIRFLLALALLAPALPAAEPAANDVVTPIALTGENVQVLVGPGISLVEGTYDYIYVRRWDNETTSAPILIDVPVFAAPDATFADLSSATDIQLKREDETYRPFGGGFVDHEAWNTIPYVPPGSRIFVFHFKLPRSAVKRRFTVTLSYTQVHLGESGKEVFALIPYLPLSERLQEDLELKPENYRLTFTAMSGTRLELVSTNPEQVSVAADKIVLNAQDRETIAIRAEKIAAP